MRQAAWGVILRVGYRLLPLARFLGLRSRHGVMVAVWHGGRVLVVRQSYRPGLTFPGGGVQAGEDRRAAAVRELREEVGVEAEAADLVPAHAGGGARSGGRGAVYRDNRGNEVDIFELHLQEEPGLRPDRREIVEAWFAPPGEAQAAGLPRLVGLYLVRVTRERAPG
jgi:8-oxo-dGTP pyrophosphatase MutT (NUDIX family)